MSRNNYKTTVILLGLVSIALAISLLLTRDVEKIKHLEQIDINKLKHFLHSQNQEEQIYALKELGKLKITEATDNILFFLCSYQNPRLQIQASIELICIRTEYAKTRIEKIMMGKNAKLQEYLLFAYQIKANKEDIPLLRFFLTMLPEKQKPKITTIIAKLF